jgi:flagellar hook-associated protein 3 FlgL
MRLSTQAFYAGSLAAMQLQVSELAKLQNQVATGRRVSTPADDPIAAVHIMELERAQIESEQFGKNSALIQNRLKLEENALADAGTILTRVRELVVQASNSATLTDADRRSIATELASRKAELQDLANRQDGNGEYLFSGFATTTKPFTTVGNLDGVVYQGDQGSRRIQVSPTQFIADSHSGFAVFMNIPEANGVFATAVGPANIGSGSISVGSVVDRNAWQPGTYTLTFTSTTDWVIRDAADPLTDLQTGTYTPGAAIDFNGVRFEISGEPATGDTFTIRESGTKDIFSTLDDLIAALRLPRDSEAAAARSTTVLESTLQQLDQASEHFLSVRAEVGARLSTLDAADDAREARKVDVESALSELRDLDYAEAITKMNQRLIGLQAAQMSYTQISQLSLFNYLK